MVRRCYIITMIDTTIIDFTDCQIDTSAQYGGSDQKRGVFYLGERYMLKLPDRIDDTKRNQWNTTYSNSIYSEKVCCDILSALGFNVQQVKLGYIRRGNEKKPVVACRNFIPMGAILLSFKTIANTLLPEKLGKVPKISEIYAVLTEKSSYFTQDMCIESLKAYWDLFILDALLGNFDRHGDNWGYFYLAGASSVVPSPIYDCGSCLYPKVADTAIESIISNETEITMRIDQFPTAALLLEDGKKANYKDFILSGVNTDCTEALLRVFPKIDLSVVYAVIESEPITDIRKSFYKIMLTERYKRILVPAYERHFSSLNANKTSVF